VQCDSAYQFQVEPNTGVDENPTQFPIRFSISEPYPNPFNSKINLQFSIPVSSEVNISFFNMNGQIVGEVSSGNYSAGSHLIKWDASFLTSGLYIVSFRMNEYQIFNKITYVK